MSSFMPPLRSNTSSLSTASPIRMPSGPVCAATLMMNKQARYEDSLYYVCLRLMNRLSKVPGMLPYMEQAYIEAEKNAELQAIALSANTESGSQTNNNNHSNNSNNNNNNINNNTNNNSNSDNHSNNYSNNNVSRSRSYRNSDPLLGRWNNALYTFSAGILPAQISYDPVTPIWALFQQGTPLCLIFNVLKPENAIDIVSSDDIKICKMNVYQFLSACKLHLSIRDDELFPITSVFSDDTTNLLKVIHSVSFVLNLDPSFDAPPVPDQLIITDARSKVVKELIESERKFVQDLDILVRYRNGLIKKELISSENINMLFPNLSEIMDFQRRFLVGLECNASVPSKYQRIGSVFVHAGAEGFKIYEAWSLFQNSAIEYINIEAHKLQKSSTLIANPYELQSFLIKPIQRLCKYPLLLRELLKLSDPSWPNYHELHQAYLISKEVGQNINEAQRKSENIQLLKDLQSKVVDWKGYNSTNVGDLLFSSVVTVKDLLTDGHSNEKEVHCFLFERVIYFFKEIQQKNKLLSSRKKSNVSISNALSSASSLNLTSSNLSINSNKSNSNNNNTNINNGGQLSLNGIVYITKIYRTSISDNSPYFSGQSGHFLTLRWKGNKDTGGCVMRFRSEEQLHHWDNAIKKLSFENELDEIYNVQNSTRSMSSINSSASLMTTNTAATSTTNRNSNNKFRSSSNSSDSSFIPKLRTTSNSSIGNITYPPLPTEKKLRSISTSSVTNSITSDRRASRSNRQSSNTSFGNDESLLSNLSNITLSQNSFDYKTNIKLTFGVSSINLSVNSDINFTNLAEQMVNKMNYSMGVDANNKKAFNSTTIRFKFRDEDGDFIRFQGDDDWTIAKEMLEDVDESNRILNIVVA